MSEGATMSRQAVRYRKRDHELWAMQWDGTPESITWIAKWVNSFADPDEQPWVTFERRNGQVLRVFVHLTEPKRVEPGDFIARGTHGDVYLYDEETFAEFYEPVGECKERKND